MSPALDYSAVADLYDSFAVFTEDLPFFVEECHQAAGAVLELMAGTGRVSIPVLQAGVDLTCTDASPEMLGVLHRKLRELKLSATVLERDARNLGFDEAFDLVILPFHSFEELLTERDQCEALRSVHAALKPGGTFICTLNNPNVRTAPMGKGLMTVRRHPSPSGKGELVLKAELEYDAQTGLVTGRQIIEEHVPGAAPSVLIETPIRFVLISRNAFEAMARDCGFVVREFYGDYGRAPFDAGTSPYMIWKLARA